MSVFAKISNAGLRAINQVDSLTKKTLDSKLVKNGLSAATIGRAIYDNDAVVDALKGKPRALWQKLTGSQSNPAPSLQDGDDLMALQGDDADWRVRLSVAPNSGILYDSASTTVVSDDDPSSAATSALLPLADTDGIVFPILAQITTTHDAKYNSSDVTHSNYQQFFYKNSAVSSIQIVGDFPVQNEEDGRYVFAAIQMLRAATKMFFGNDSNGISAGTPPPILRLNGYGKHYFPNVPVVVTSFSHVISADVDYLRVYVNGNGYVRIPTWSQLQVTVQPMYSRKQVRGFNYDDFATGRDINKGFL